MNEMIERVARSMYDPNSLPSNGAKNDCLLPPWEEISAADRSRFLSYAHSAIEALRNPPREMLDVVEEDLLMSPTWREEIWDTMLDEILK